MIGQHALKSDLRALAIEIAEDLHRSSHALVTITIHHIREAIRRRCQTVTGPDQTALEMVAVRRLIELTGGDTRSVERRKTPVRGQVRNRKAASR